ncbi:FemAB family XrtA/PEP-CTERM system-associated protein [Qipengyuania nanhaisediminis]|uniref:FemAB family XrtA/PEP-CTERM system-associated protein n=1 Tax=Qipengyuania nanhaisediminis TaxID=604088 RepID=UPI0038B27AA9
MNMALDTRGTVTVTDLDDPFTVDSIEVYVRRQRGSLFHRPAWLNAVAQATGHRAMGLIAEKMGAITGWLPLTRVQSRLFGKALVSSGFGVGGGVLCDDSEVGFQLCDHASQIAAAEGFDSVELRGGAIPEGWTRHEDKHCGFERELASDDEEQLLAIPRKARAEVRKALKSDLEVRIGREQHDLAEHYSVYSQSVRNLGTPVFPKRLFETMLDAFPDSSDILTVSRRGEPLASVLSFYHDGAVLPFWGGGSRDARAARANELMYYELMLHARRQGMRRFDFGRSKTGSGPYHFKKNWGFTPQPLVYGEWVRPGALARNVDPTSASYARKIALWKKLPLPLANALGPLVARDLA